MRSPTPRAVALAVALPLGLMSVSACSSDLRLRGSAQTVTVTAPATATVKGARLRVAAVSGGGVTLDAGGVRRVLRAGDSFSVDDVRFTLERVDDRTHAATLTGVVEFVLPWHL